MPKSSRRQKRAGLSPELARQKFRTYYVVICILASGCVVAVITVVFRGSSPVRRRGRTELVRQRHPAQVLAQSQIRGVDEKLQVTGKFLVKKEDQLKKLQAEMDVLKSSVDGLRAEVAQLGKERYTLAAVSSGNDPEELGKAVEEFQTQRMEEFCLDASRDNESIVTIFGPYLDKNESMSHAFNPVYERITRGSKEFRIAGVYSCPPCKVWPKNQSCIQCITAGRYNYARPRIKAHEHDGEQFFEQVQSRMARLTRITYDKGVPWLSGGRTQWKGKDFRRAIGFCYEQCGPMWFMKKMPWKGPKAMSGMKYISDAESPSIECGKDDFTQTALVFNDLYELFSYNQVYHYLQELLLPVFMTAAHVAMQVGCDWDAVKIVYYEESLIASNSPILVTWDAIFGPRKLWIGELSGCFQSIYYGGLHMQNWPVTMRKAFSYDPIQSTWVSAMRKSLHEYFHLPSLPEKTFPFLVVPHYRNPPWMRDWFRKRRFNLPSMKMIYVDMGDGRPFTHQLKLVSRCRGIISQTGSVLTMQYFLPPMSMLLNLDIWQWVGPIPVQPKCDFVLEGASNNIALHLGHSYIDWLWCKPKGVGWSRSAYTTIVHFLIRKNEEARKGDFGFVCWILNNDDMDPLSGQPREWPNCDRLVTAPRPTYNKGCGQFPYVGESFRDTPTYWRILFTDRNDSYNMVGD